MMDLTRRRRTARTLLVAIAATTVALTAGDASAADTRRFCHSWSGDGPRGDGAPICIALDTYPQDVCRAIRYYADAHGLPRGFFTRLIWQESRFNANAVSPANALGIAQFIPSTARMRGLRNPYNPAEALSASAAYLAELRDEFGSLGMAAVAYNAGEGRAARVLAGGGAPYETQGYVAIITGHSIDAWRGEAPPEVDYRLEPETPFDAACLKLATTAKLRRFEGEALAAPPPWGVQLAAHKRSSVAARMFSRVRKQFRSLIGGEAPVIVRERGRARGARRLFAARVGRETRGEAIRLCKRLRARGAACTVARN